MKHAALGFRVHSGWTALVALSMENDSPAVLARQRPLLVETFTYDFRQPYHTAEKMPIAEAHEFVSRVKTEATRLACKTIRLLQKDLGKQGYRLNRCGLLLASGRSLPDFAHILASHALIHTADGELFRDAIKNACSRCKLSVVAFKERDLFNEASKSFDLQPAVLKRRVSAFGKSVGPPWSADEKLATLVAWLALAK